MKCHAGVEFPSGKPCPKCNAKLGEVCWPGINADLLELARLRVENERLRSGVAQQAPTREQIARVIAGKIACEQDCASDPSGCGCSDDAADAVMVLYSPELTSTADCMPSDLSDGLPHLNRNE